MNPTIPGPGHPSIDPSASAPGPSADVPPAPSVAAAAADAVEPEAAAETLPADAAAAPDLPLPGDAAGQAATLAGARRRPAWMTWLALGTVAVLAGSAIFVSGFTLGRQTALTAGTPDQLQADFQPFWDAFNAIEQRYAGDPPVDRHALLEGALSGMFQAIGDPYSSYMSSEEYKKSLTSVSGQFEGIGATMETRDAKGNAGCSPMGATCQLVVMKTLPGSPATRSGVLAGDVVVSIDGASVDGLTIDQAVAKIRGPRGTKVVLALQRGTESLSITIARDVINSQDVTSQVMADGLVGYMRISSFGAASAADFRTQLADLVQAKKITRIVLDLRDDPGGFVDQARTIASQFIGSGTIYWEQVAGGGKTAWLAESGGVATDRSISLVVLVNKGTASASELLAGALQDTHRGLLIGGTTYGKGIMQEWDVLGNDMGGFRLTTARWLTPDGRWIQKKGLTPDVAVTVPANVAPGADPVLDRGIQVLTSASASVPASDDPYLTSAAA